MENALNFSMFFAPSLDPRSFLHVPAPCTPRHLRHDNVLHNQDPSSLTATEALAFRAKIAAEGLR